MFYFIRYDRHVFTSQTGINIVDIYCSYKSLEYLQLYIFKNRLQTIYVTLGHIWGKYQLLHNQTIDLPNNLSLMVSAAITLLNGHTDNLFFCNVNIYRSTGTVDRHTQNAGYVSSMRRERARSIDAKKTNAAVEMT